MASGNFKKQLFTFGFIFSLAACGPANSVYSERLNDDPSTEQVFSGNMQKTSSVNLSSLNYENPPAGSEERTKILQRYDYVDPNKIIAETALENAIIFYDLNLSQIKNKNVLTIIDYSKSSKEKRAFIIDMKTGGVQAFHVAHGKGSDSNHDGMAEKFSNTPGSNATSLGYFMTAETYQGGNGYSLRLDGLSSTNSNARSRAIVIHGSDYVQDRSVIQGRSWGCPAFSQANKNLVINLLKGGSVVLSVGPS
ncbi:murein L,D-transpeptidase catalytic domain family protein [Bdellovibrio svalbardensis]|uniref:Murein L,D-transpeptidase catalytic domain family protein n=1 Tax=Bdellovibrio svalbardensis TaxID=2972972 RepID=A0ABT6DLB2_9BACT|nr:murein L,D-transpeptidase catalytic domain family protein [Bdellovibrio svalbardensis]MDG0817307.1 murein L,D-transpeptidase catalytic domain family protein [Bdellovibrio svalbardensis]